MKIQVWFMYLICLAVLPVMAPAQQTSCSHSLVEFDAPLASPAPGLGTLAWAINNRGEVVGWYFDTNAVYYAFLRTPDGRITPFEAPGANTGSPYHGTSTTSINDFGVITGPFGTPDFFHHSFVRYVDGSFATFDAPDAGNPYLGTTAAGINLQGAIAGYYQDEGSIFHGFVRSPGGAITEFDPAGSVFTYVCEGTCFNPAGTITGYYLGPDANYHGFLRRHDGKIMVFDAPGADTSGNYNGTFPASINLGGSITGYYVDPNYVYHGFVRSPDGHIATFDAPGADETPGAYLGTFPSSINALGVIAGYFYDANIVGHGFSRSPNGTFVTIDAPDAGTTIGSGQGTYAFAINLQGTVAGQYSDTNGGNHGFVWTPPCGKNK